MAIKFNPILGTLILVVIVTVLLHVCDAQGGLRVVVIVGGWKPITNLTDPEVVEIGKFAVDEHNKEAKTKLEYQEIIKGESQVVSGTNYRLIITAKDGDSPHNYLAEVWNKPWKKFRNLTSFRQCTLQNGEEKCTFT
ncbi:Cysteine proteinase inhibitor 1 [Capsicum chinense]|nr:Cysteine proteinase inhibitor 1 [Capsicum chinense]